MTYFAALGFKRSEDCEIVSCDPKEARYAEQAIRSANSLATKEEYWGAVAMSRTGDPVLGNSTFRSSVGEVDTG